LRGQLWIEAHGEKADAAPHSLFPSKRGTVVGVTLDRTAGVSIGGELNAGAERLGASRARSIAANAEINIFAITKITTYPKTFICKYVDFLKIVLYMPCWHALTSSGLRIVSTGPRVGKIGTFKC
jgi:hypothetical protein